MSSNGSERAARKPPAAARAPAQGGAALDALSAAVESGAGLPAVARAAARVLDASVALVDRSSAVLAVAAASPAEEAKLLEGGAGVSVAELRVADSVVGELRYRPRSGSGEPAVARVMTALLGLELERARAGGGGAGSGRGFAGARARRGARRLLGRRRAEPVDGRSGGPVPGGEGGRAGRERRRRGGGRAARVRGHRLLPASPACDERGPGRARALLRGDDRPARRLRRAVRDRAAGDRG